MNSIALVDEAFVSTNQPAPTPPARPVALTAAGKPWNIVLFVLESTGMDYVFDDAHGRKEPPMPFLQKIMRESLCLTNHQASANSSSQAAFSIFTGLYPPPTHTLSTMSETLSIPTLNRYLGTNYHFFLVHPTEASYSFPEHLFLNNGLNEFDNLNTLPPGPHPGKLRLARNEIDTMDYFKSRLEQVRQPFLAVYWSFIPHHPYSDYGPEFRIRSDRDNPRDRYYNNLRCLDVQIQRVFEHLTKVGLLDQTLFAFVGDHGEAFNQHPNVWIHSFGSYGEMYRVPIFFWQPKLVAPQTINFFTSHVDITPTLLDLLGVPFDPARFQGGSVLRGEPNRKYIFSMDARAVFVNAIGRDRKKVSLCFNDDEALAFDLAKDPAEKYPLNEYRLPEQIEALFKFCNYQKQLVEDYNQAILAGREFPQKTP